MRRLVPMRQATMDRLAADAVAIGHFFKSDAIRSADGTRWEVPVDEEVVQRLVAFADTWGIPYPGDGLALDIVINRLLDQQGGVS